MVTPAHSSDCANVEHDRHAAFARTCVVAYWRMLPTRERYALLPEAETPHVILFSDPSQFGLGPYSDTILKYLLRSILV